MKFLHNVLLTWLCCVTILSQAEPAIPDDVRYMIEDLYGIDRSKWPAPILSQDINGDDLPDWVAQQPGCKTKGECTVDLFLCKKATGTQCKEHCYVGSGKLEALRNKPGGLVCESTC